jgi:hypothetical protein
MHVHGFMAGIALVAGLSACGGGSDESPPPADEVSEIMNGAARASAASHWRRQLTQSTELIAFYSNGSGDFRSGGSCASGAMTWTRTSGTSLSVSLPSTSGTTQCATTLTLTSISAGGGQFTATSGTGQSLTYTLVGTPIP